MDRRDFLKTGVVAIAGLATATELLGEKSGHGPIARRPLGKTAEQLSIFGFGGTAVMSIEQTEANNLVAEAFDLGVNFYDVSPNYGNAEERMGPALEPYRKRCFLASKTDFRGKTEAEAGLAQSLKTLRTEHFDLYQHHAVDKMSELEQIFGPNGAQEAFVAAKKGGKVRYLGLSTHSIQVAMAAMKHGGLDTMMFPINYVLVTKSNFGPEVLQYANDHGIGFIAIKAMARGKYAAGVPEAKRTPKCWYEPCTLPEEAALAYRWTLSKAVTAAIPPGNAEWFRIALKAAQSFEPITESDTKKLLSYLEGANPLFP